MDCDVNKLDFASHCNVTCDAKFALKGQKLLQCIVSIGPTHFYRVRSKRAVPAGALECRFLKLTEEVFRGSTWILRAPQAVNQVTLCIFHFFQYRTARFRKHQPVFCDQSTRAAQKISEICSKRLPKHGGSPWKHVSRKKELVRNVLSNIISTALLTLGNSQYSHI